MQNIQIKETLRYNQTMSLKKEFTIIAFKTD